jgi:hypothetical protein
VEGDYYVCADAAACGSAWSTGDDGNVCTSRSSPCATLAGGIGKLSPGDTLVVGNGTYAQPITDMPSGTADAYTVLQAEHDFGPLIDGSGWANEFTNGISVNGKSYVTVQGFRVRMSQTNLDNLPVQAAYSDHVKLIRIGASHGPVDGNAATFDIGPDSDYVLVEECYAYGGSRYQFLAYWTDHVIFRRNVARVDYWIGTLQCSCFTNYDSVNTVWQNNIALDSDTADCAGGLYGGFYFENKDDHADDTTQTLVGNIVLNVSNSYYSAGMMDRNSGTHTIEHMIIYGGESGYAGEQAPGDTAVAAFDHWTVGGLWGTYDGANGKPAGGTAVAQTEGSSGVVTNNLIKNSIFWNNASYGIADYTVSDYNVFYGNGAAVGGDYQTPTVGTHSSTTTDPATNGLRYLPRLEAGSPLETAGEGGTKVGAEVMARMGASGTLYGEAGWDVLTDAPLWPFPNEAQIKTDMASYAQGGGAGERGFCAGTSLDGTPQSLTKYVWEYLGNPIPSDVDGVGP